MAVPGLRSTAQLRGDSVGARWSATKSAATVAVVATVASVAARAAVPASSLAAGVSILCRIMSYGGLACRASSVARRGGDHASGRRVYIWKASGVMCGCMERLLSTVGIVATRRDVYCVAWKAVVCVSYRECVQTSCVTLTWECAVPSAPESDPTVHRPPESGPELAAAASVERRVLSV